LRFFHRYEAYGPLRNVDLGDSHLKTIAAAHKVSTAQVALRWITQQGCPLAVSPGLNQEYAVEDMELGGFTLAATEMATISAM
jgi:diketogulonate reductase-like aldo/keto reductase